MRLFFSPRYTVDLGEHVFATAKFSAVAAELLRRGLASDEDFVEPAPASRDDLLLVHDAAWVDRVLQGRLSAEDLERLELPASPVLTLAHRLHAQGTIEACREASRTGLGVHVGGGSHHAFAGHGEGYCLFNDLALGVRKTLAEGRARRVLIADLDVHQGNGTASIFAGETRVFTFSMHQESNYPIVKPPSSLDIGLEDGTGDEDYLDQLRSTFPRLLDEQAPDLVVYQAGVDAFERDQLGGLALTEAGLRERDRIVFRESFKRGCPVAMTLGGGYAAEPADTVRLHANTIEEGVLLQMKLWKTEKTHDL